jgi:threonine/homoserine/homoserine lactone efflux protein
MMAFPDLFSYFATLVAIAVAPGPMLLLLMTRAASNDVTGAVGFALGAALGSLTIITAVCFGLSAWLSTVPDTLAFSKYLMLAYILWIAWDIWKGGFDMNRQTDGSRSGLCLSVCAGYSTCILSPYMLVLFPLVLPEVMDLRIITMPDYLIICLTTFFAEAFAAALVVGLATQLRRLARAPRSMRLMNRSLAMVLLFGGGWMALA